MKIIVGLGNPGKKYEATRHNVGFMVIDYLADKLNFEFNKRKEKGLVAEGFVNGEKVMLVKPQTYMNLSGICVSGLVNFYKLAVNDIIVIYDDLDLDVGRLRIRPSGSAGGHKGMKSIIEHLGTNEIVRIKVGIGKDEKNTINHVLGIFTEEEWNIIKEVIPKAAEAAEKLLKEDIEKVMNIYNKNYRYD